MGGTSPSINAPTTAEDQYFKFISTGDGLYNIVRVSDGKYLSKDASSAWASLWVEAASADANDAAFSIELGESSYVKLKNKTSGAYVGVDAVTDASSIYVNKASTNNVNWMICTVNKGGIADLIDVYVSEINTSIAQAESLLASASIGTSIGQYPQLAKDNLTTALSAAKEAVAGTDQNAILDAFSALPAAITTFKATEIKFLLDSNLKYNIINYDGRYVLGTFSSSALQLGTATGTDEQAFRFVEVDGEPGVYNIQQVSTNFYLGENTSWAWNFTLAEGTDITLPAAKYTIEDVDGTYKYIKCKNRGYWGAEGSGVYRDKASGVTTSKWKIVEKPVGLFLDAINASISQAETAIAGASIGSDIGQYPQEALDLLNIALSTAKTAAAGTDQQIINSAQTALATAITTFLASKKAFAVTPGQTYNIVHSSGNFLAGSDKVIIEAVSGAVTQNFKFVEVEGELSVYNIQQVSSGAYLTKSGSYNFVWGTDPSLAVAKFTVESAGDYIVFKCKDNSLYAGTDAATSGSGVYSNKSNTAVNSQWTIQAYDPSNILNICITTANNLLKNATIGEKSHQYPQAAADALQLAIDAAKAQLLGTSDEIVTAIAALNASITTFTASEVTPHPETDAVYRISNRKYNTKYIGNTAGSATAAVNKVVLDATQYWRFVKVEGENNIYYILNGAEGTLALGADYSLSEFNSSSSQKWTLSYSTTASGIDYFGILSSTTNCMALSLGTTLVSQTYSSTNTAHLFFMTKVDLPYDTDKSALSTAITNSKTTAASKEVADEIGCWPTSAYATFTSVIAKAQTMFESSGISQDEVNAMVLELNAAESTFILAGPIELTVNKEAFLAAITSAKELKTSMILGEKQGEYLLSVIRDFEKVIAAAQITYDGVTKQSDADAATTQLLLDIKTYKEKANATDVAISNVITDAVAILTNEYEASAANEGINKGQYSPVVRATFSAAITAATTATPSKEVLETLMTAYTTFLSSKMTTDRTAFATAITSAEKSIQSTKIGDFNGQTAQATLDIFQAALDAAKVVYNDYSATQEQLNAAVTSLKQAGTTFAAGVVVIDFSALKNAISVANAALAAAEPEKGAGSGTYPESAFTTLQEVIDAAVLVNGSTTVNQTTVNQSVESLTAATTTFNASRIPNDYSALQTLLSEAKTLESTTPVGSVGGAAPDASHQTLLAAITKAELSLTSTVQTDINKAVSVLKMNVSIFKKAISTVGLSSIFFSEVSIYAQDGVLYMKNLPLNSSVSLYTKAGILIKSIKNMTDWNISLNSDTYLVVLELSGETYTVKIKVD